MHRRVVRLVLAVISGVLVLGGLAALAPLPEGVAQASNITGTLLVGDPPPAADLDAAAELEDIRTGNTYLVRIIAEEEDPGVGHVTMNMDGSGLVFCTARGPSAEIDFGQVGDPFDTDFPGNSPLGSISCGTAYGMAVDVNPNLRTADISYHGYLHSDFPNITYMGMVTVDVSFAGRGLVDALEVTIHTPKGPIDIRGNLDQAGVVASN